MAVENPFDQKRGYQFGIEIEGEIKPLHDSVIVTEMDFNDRKLASGILLLGDDGKTDGIRPRWARVYAIGSEQRDVSVGQWVLIEHGRWSRGLKIIRDGEEIIIHRADPQAIIFASENKPDDIETISTAVHAERKRREQYE
ncbi:GroES chaperonin family [uncultured Caudovirales phage]|uniref:GroES chaperonin family n=1 Tax=uncultured Caudovirales phage TaxID=2100421 RepID=A0A6J5LJ45_9CAUD|nr:GroES chaperonin family [uncultured Caudovirales phage]